MLPFCKTVYGEDVLYIEIKCVYSIVLLTCAKLRYVVGKFSSVQLQWVRADKAGKDDGETESREMRRALITDYTTETQKGGRVQLLASDSIKATKNVTFNLQ